MCGKLSFIVDGKYVFKLFGIQFCTKIMENVKNLKWGRPPRPPRSKRPKKPHIYFHFFLNSISNFWPPPQYFRKRGCAFPKGNIAQELGMIFFTVFCSILLCNKNSHFTLHKIQKWNLLAWSSFFFHFAKIAFVFIMSHDFCHLLS